MNFRYFIAILSIVVLTACGGKQKAPDSQGSSDVKGEEVYNRLCKQCHGADGTQGVSGAKDLTQSILTMDERIQVITDGRGLMPGYKSSLSEEEIKAVAEYTASLKQ